VAGHDNTAASMVDDAKKMAQHQPKFAFKKDKDAPQ